LGLSIAISGGITIFTIIVIFSTIFIASDKIHEEGLAGTLIFENDDEISKTKLEIYGLNATVSSNLVNFTLKNVGIEKLWKYDEFDFIITYDADIGGISTRVNEQLTYNPTAFALSPAVATETEDFKIQHGCTTIAAAAFSRTLTTGADYDAPSGEAFTRITNTRLTGNGVTAGGGNQNVEDFTAYISDASDLTTQIVFTRDNNPGTNTRICYEIIEYIGISGAENSFVVLDQNSVSYAAGSLTVSGATIPGGATDDDDVVVFITGQAGHEATDRYWNQAMSIAEWNPNYNRPEFKREEAAQDANDNDISYAVVEFTGSNWRVKHFEYSHIVPGDDNIQADVIMDGLVGRPDPVNDLSKTFLHTQFVSFDGTGIVATEQCGLDDCGANAWLSAADTLSFHYDGSFPNLQSMNTTVWIIENNKGTGTTMKAQHIAGSKSGGPVEDVFAIAIPIPVASLSTTSIWGENSRSTGTLQEYPRGAIALELTGLGTVTGYRSDNGETQTYRFSVVEYPQSEKCIGGDSSLIAVNEWTFSCITYDVLDPEIINAGEASEILTKLEYRIFAGGLLEIILATDNGKFINKTTIVT